MSEEEQAARKYPHACNNGCIGCVKPYDHKGICEVYTPPEYVAAREGGYWPPKRRRRWPFRGWK